MTAGHRTSEFKTVAVAIVVMVGIVLLAHDLWMRQTALVSIPAVASVYAACRTMTKILAKDMNMLNVKQMITTAIETEVTKLLKVTTPSDQAIVNAAVEANVNLALLVVEKDALASLIAKYPVIGTAISAAGLAV